MKRKLDELIKELDEYFDAFIILGSIYMPETQETRDMRYFRGNRHIIQSMIAEENEGVTWGDEEYEYDG